MYILKTGEESRQNRLAILGGLVWLSALQRRDGHYRKPPVCEAPALTATGLSLYCGLDSTVLALRQGAGQLGRCHLSSASSCSSPYSPAPCLWPRTRHVHPLVEISSLGRPALRSPALTRTTDPQRMELRSSPASIAR